MLSLNSYLPELYPVAEHVTCMGVPTVVSVKLIYKRYMHHDKNIRNVLFLCINMWR